MHCQAACFAVRSARRRAPAMENFTVLLFPVTRDRKHADQTKMRVTPRSLSFPWIFRLSSSSNGATTCFCSGELTVLLLFVTRDRKCAVQNHEVFHFHGCTILSVRQDRSMERGHEFAHIRTGCGDHPPVPLLSVTQDQTWDRRRH